MSERSASPALELRGIRKTYPGVVAVDGVDLTLYPGEIHALVGENGAGKSTLSAIAFGEVSPDAGTVEANGTVGLVHQHFELVGRLRVWQNVLLGREPRRGWRIDADAARARVADLAQRNGLAIDPDAFVDDLPVGVQQRVELLRELDRDPSVLLLDEPTAALAPAEIDSFFASITKLAQSGTAILIVTHKLQEVHCVFEARHRHAPRQDRRTHGDGRNDDRSNSAGHGRRRDSRRRCARGNAKNFPAFRYEISAPAAVRARFPASPSKLQPAKSSALPASKATDKQRLPMRSPVCCRLTAPSNATAASA